MKISKKQLEVEYMKTEVHKKFLPRVFVVSNGHSTS